MSLLEVKVPDIGDFKDVPIVTIFVKSGDVVKQEDSLLTLESDKASIDIPSPAAGEGTSIVALSDSSEISESSGFTVSPGFTNTSMTGMSLKSPMSGTLTSKVLIASPAACRPAGRPGTR